MRTLRSVLLSREDAVSGRLLVNILEKADPDALHHGVAVAELSSVIGRHAGVDPNRLGLLWLAGLLHDIGKLGVPAKILAKSSNLSPSESRYIEHHTMIGRFMLNRFFSPGSLGEVILNHHERWDGNGYPRRRSGEDIPLEARIIAIVDTYDAARSAGWLLHHKSHKTVMAEIKAGATGAFDPALVRVTLKYAAELHTCHDAVRRLSAHDLREHL